MPWISNEVLGMLREQMKAQAELIDAMRGDLALAYRHQRTVERVELKLPEREPEVRKPPEPVDEGVMELVNLYPEPTRSEMLSSVRAARQENPPLSWAQIAEGIMATMPAPLLARLNGSEDE